MRLSYLASWIVSLMFAPNALGAVVIVDAAGGPGVFTTFHAALAAAAEGDTILVRAGNYGIDPNDPFGGAIQGKSLSVVADPAGAAVQLGALWVANLNANQVVVLRGVDISGDMSVTGFFDTPGLTVQNCAGSVVVEDATIVGGQSGPGPHMPIPGYSGITVTGSRLTLTHCVVVGGAPYGGDPFNGPGSGGPALVATNASIAVFETELRGTSPVIQSAGMPSGYGAKLTGTKAMFSGSTLIGGNVSTCTTCPAAAALVADVTSAVRWIDTQFVPGTGGTSAPPIDAPLGVVSSWPGIARALTLTSPVVEFQPVNVTVDGVAGDLVMLAWSMKGAHVPLAIPGWLVVAPPFFGPFVLGSIAPPAKTLSFSVAAPALVPSTIDAFTFFLQPLVVNGPDAFAGAPSAFTLLR